MKINIMYKVKDISKVKMNEGNVLIKLYEKESNIILPEKDEEDMGPQVEFAEIVAKAKDIEDVEIGDIVLDLKSCRGFEWQGDHYAVVHRLSIGLIVSKDNFDPKAKKPDKKLKS